MAEILRGDLIALTALDDGELRQLIYQTARDAGVGEITARMLSAGVRGTRERIVSASDEEVTAVVSFIGEAKINEILRKIHTEKPIGALSNGKL